MTPAANSPVSASGLTTSQLTAAVKDEARRLGFSLVGVAPAVSPTGFTRLGEWLERGYAGQMHYLASRHAAYEHPRHVLDGVRSVVMLGLPYGTETPRLPRPGEGRISRYAWGTADYHDLAHDKLRALVAFIKAQRPEARCRGVIDTAPLLEREFAQLAGLGWIGKHTLLINKPAGSYFFLAALLTDQALGADEPFGAEHCGTCRACLDACPTQAFPQPYVLDASRCISYLTIELREAIPLDLRQGIGDWLFGCDICQEVCPWNEKQERHADTSTADGVPPGANIAADFWPRGETNPVDLMGLFELDDAAFRRRFRETPLWRSRRRGILRNAAIVLGNQRHAPAVPVLVRALDNAEPLIRGACAWALGQLGGEAATAALLKRQATEADTGVLHEISLALQRIPSG